MIIKKKIKPEDIGFLQNKKALYISDFRSISESMDYEIPTMWKYENLFPWILTNQNVIVNEDSKNLNYLNKNNLILIYKNSDSKKSIFERINDNIYSEVLDLFVAIPHPQADLLAQKNGLKLNYSYSDFLRRNDKFTQKELFANLSPEWFKIKSFEDIDFLLINNRRGFIKRRQGSGGFTVFEISKTKENKNFELLFRDNPFDWYFEDYIEGKPFSIQCVKNENDTIIFGFSEQQIIDGHYFIGSKILSLDKIQNNLFQALKDCIDKLSPLLNDYNGFFGIDFIIDKKNNPQILEANIRMTAATIPTLITNYFGSNEALFMEDVRLSEIKRGDLVLACHNDEVDFIRLF